MTLYVAMCKSKFNTAGASKSCVYVSVCACRVVRMFEWTGEGMGSGLL